MHIVEHTKREGGNRGDCLPVHVYTRHCFEPMLNVSHCEKKKKFTGGKYHFHLLPRFTMQMQVGRTLTTIAISVFFFDMT